MLGKKEKTGIERMNENVKIQLALGQLNDIGKHEVLKVATNLANNTKYKKTAKGG